LWEITSKARKYPIGLQVKQKYRPYAIRPFPFHKKPEKSFNNIQEFVKAVYETRKLFLLDDMIDPDMWYEKVSKGVQDKKIR